MRLDPCGCDLCAEGDDAPRGPDHMTAAQWGRLRDGRGHCRICGAAPWMWCDTSEHTRFEAARLRRVEYCHTCGDRMDMFEREIAWEHGGTDYDHDCRDCEVAAAMHAAVAKGENELDAEAEVRGRWSENIRRIDERERFL